MCYLTCVYALTLSTLRKNVACMSEARPSFRGWRGWHARLKWQCANCGKVPSEVCEDRHIEWGQANSKWSKPSSFLFEALYVYCIRTTQFRMDWSLQWKFNTDNGFRYVCLISAPSIPQASNTPYKAGGAVHVVDCCLFFVQSGFWYLLSAAAAYCHQLLMAMVPPCTPVGGNGQFVARIRVRYKQQWQ